MSIFWKLKAILIIKISGTTELKYGTIWLSMASSQKYPCPFCQLCEILNYKQHVNSITNNWVMAYNVYYIYQYQDICMVSHMCHKKWLLLIFFSFLCKCYIAQFESQYRYLLSPSLFFNMFLLFNHCTNFVVRTPSQSEYGMFNRFGAHTSHVGFSLPLSTAYQTIYHISYYLCIVPMFCLVRHSYIGNRSIPLNDWLETILGSGKCFFFLK